MYERKRGAMDQPLASAIPFVGGRSAASVIEQLGVAREAGTYQEASVYCGRVLLSIEIEERSEKREPSPAQIAMKPKDCIDLWADPSQKLFFRFNAIYGQDFPVDGLYSYVQVEFNVGRRSICTNPQKIADTGLFPFLQSLEVEMDLPFDDVRDNPEGQGKPSADIGGLWKPLAFVERLPDIFVKVYKVTNPLVPDISRQMIGMWRGTVVSVLGGGDAENWMQNCYIGNEKADNQTAGAFEGVSSIALAPGEDPPVPSKHYPWGKHGTDQEHLLSHRILNPYTGFQMVRLVQDSTCALGPEDPSGFVGFSCKLWMPSRFRCSNVPPKGPPILSPWRMWNSVPILPPWHDYLKWYKYFTLRAHIYQAQDLAARNSTGVANAFVELRCLKQETKRTHTAYMTNHPTFDTTLDMPDVPLYLLPSDPAVGAEEYRQLTNPSEPVDATDVDSNHDLLRMAPRFEIRVYEENGEAPLLIGRQYISAHEVLTRKVDPSFLPIFKGNPDVHEGKLFCSFQVIESSENLLKAPLRPLIPDRSFVKMEHRETWTSPAPQRPVKMFDCKIQIQVLGIRDLTSPYPFGRPVLKPQIEVCCDDPKTAITTKPSNKPSGTDANFLECVDIALLMPEDKEYAPVIEVFVYDHSLYGQDMSFVPGPLRPVLQRPTIVAYGSMPTLPFYASDESDVGSDSGSDDENEEAAKKRKAKEEMKKFQAMAQELRRSGRLTAQNIKTLEKLFAKKDEAVFGAFKQYTDDADASKFADRITSFLFEKRDKAAVAAQDEKNKPSKATALKKGGAPSTTGRTADSEQPDNRTNATDDRDETDFGAGLEVASEENEAQAVEERRETDAAAAASGAIEEGDKMEDDQDENADAQDHDDQADEIGVAEGLTGEDDQLPDKQEIVDTPDGKPNLEWLLLRAHPMLNCPMENSTVEEYGQKIAWQPRLADVFDEIALYRDPIDPVRCRQVGTLKCKVKLFKLESQEAADQRGEEPRWLDMNELKRGNEVEYEVPDVNENYPGRDVEIRVYLLRAFQISPTQVVDGIAKASNTVKIRVGGETWEWTSYYDPVVALNPTFYQCAKIIAKLPGPSMLHVQLLDDTPLGIANPLADILDPVPMPARFNFGNPAGPQLIGETIVDLEDRWFCKEWTDNTVYKPREVRDLYNEDKQPGLSVGKMMLMVDAVLYVDSDEKPPRNINVAGRQMPMEMRVIVWNLRDVSPKEGYTSNVQVGLELMGWGREKETDQDMGVKQSRLAMFNYRLKFKGLKYPSPDPTIPAKDFLLKVHVSSADFLGIGPNKTIAEGIIPLQPLFLDCFQKNLGKGSPDDMEIVSLDASVEGGEPAGAVPGALDPGFGADSEGTRYPYKWFKLVHPGGPGCKNDKDFAPPGYDFVKNCQCKIQLSIQIMPRAKGRAVPATNGFSRGPAKLVDPNRPPQPKNPIFDPVGCGKYIAYSCRECCLQCKWPCLCLCCILLVVVFFIAYFYLNQVGLVPKL